VSKWGTDWGTDLFGGEVPTPSNHVDEVDMGKLTARMVQTAGPGKHEDGEGLRLVVAATGSRKWVLRVTMDGKRREMGLGAFPAVTLAQARARAVEARKEVHEG
jgi:hypothetical protein